MLSTYHSCTFVCRMLPYCNADMVARPHFLKFAEDVNAAYHSTPIECKQGYPSCKKLAPTYSLMRYYGIV